MGNFESTPMQLIKSSEKIPNPDENKIRKRRLLEQKALEQGKLSFEAAKSNSGVLVEKPDIVIENPNEIEEWILEMGRNADRIVCEGLRQELEKHNLLPDNKTFYLIDFGLPHLPALQSVMLDYGIDPSIYTNPSEDTLRSNVKHFRRYVSVYKEHAEELFDKRERLKQPKGFALLVNSHAESDEMKSIAKILPSVDQLRQLGISRIVLGKEIFYHHGAPDPKDSAWKSFFEASEINEYAKQMNDSGIEVVVIGFDYRCKNKPEEPQSIDFGDFDPSYQPSAVEIYESSICQSELGKRMVFDRKSGRIYKIINGFERPATDDEIIEFSNNLLDAGLSDEEIAKIRTNLPQGKRQ